MQVGIVEVCALRVCLVQPRGLQMRVAEVGATQDGASEPDLVVDIGGFIDTKLERLRCHTSQLGEQLDDEDTGFVDGMAEFTAAKEPFRYSEAFRAFRFDLPWNPPEAELQLGEA